MASEKEAERKAIARRQLDRLWAMYDLALPSEQVKLRAEIEHHALKIYINDV